jgi:hypothetical protein
VKIPMNDSNRKPVDEDSTLTESEDPSLAAYPKSARAAIAKRKAAKADAEGAKVLQFPVWPEPKRGTPNSFLRSALFSAIQGKDRRFLDGEILASQGGYTVKFTGKQLNQEDLTVWETLVHLARQHPLGTVCSFTAHGLLKAIGLPAGGCNHKTLHSSIIRLTGGVVEVTTDGKRYFGTLVESGAKDEVTSHYIIKLNPDILRLYGENQWTSIDWKQRMAMKRKPLAQALHAYFSSHKKPFPVTLIFLQKITGSRNVQMASFKRQCRTALDNLKAIGFLESYSIDGDRLTVGRSPFPLPSQE